MSLVRPRSPGAPQPLAGLRVVEFTHMVMGPTCGMVLADMGAEVIKVEPIDGDRTRRLLGAGSGFFPMFNRNKKSIAIDLRQPEGAEAARRIAASADVVAENFKPDTMGKYGLDYAALSAINPRIIYAACKGFLPGPYDHRTALDEVVQMMGGLAYMTGRPGDPLRAGSSVNDIMGGMFAAIAVLGALVQRGVTGRGMEVQSALFENNVFLVGQHMLQYAPISKPEDLFDDPHLAATGGLADVRVPDGAMAGRTVKSPLFPIAMEGKRLPVRLDPPRIGEHTRELLASVGYAPEAIDALIAGAAVA